ncbi:MAG: hypothetical protein ACO1QS_03360 [Verrucomicrobiota bacterium]
MFIPLGKRGSSAFSKVDLFIILGVVFLLGGMVTTALTKNRSNQLIKQCSSNNKQLAMSMKMWSHDSYQGTVWNDRNPGGSIAFTNSGMVLPHFLAMSNEIGQAKILTCPNDNRRAVTNWAALREWNISYFINFDAEETKPNRVLFGDRRFSSSLAPNAMNMLVLNVNSTYEWEPGIHGKHGVLSYGDGSVRQFPVNSLNAEFQNITNLGSRIQLPR